MRENGERVRMFVARFMLREWWQSLRTFYGRTEYSRKLRFVSCFSSLFELMYIFRTCSLFFRLGRRFDHFGGIHFSFVVLSLFVVFRQCFKMYASVFLVIIVCRTYGGCFVS